MQGNNELGYKNTHVPSTDSIANDSNSGSGSSSRSSDGMTTPDVDDVVDIFISEPPQTDVLVGFKDGYAWGPPRLLRRTRI